MRLNDQPLTAVVLPGHEPVGTHTVCRYGSRWPSERLPTIAVAYRLIRWFLRKFYGRYRGCPCRHGGTYEHHPIIDILKSGKPAIKVSFSRLYQRTTSIDENQTMTSPFHCHTSPIQEAVHSCHVNASVPTPLPDH